MPFQLVFVIACGYGCPSSVQVQPRSFPSFHQCFVAGFVRAHGNTKFRCRQTPQKPVLSRRSETPSPDRTKTVETALVKHESGGNPWLVNRFGYAGLFQFGAPCLADLEVYTPGPNEKLRNWTWDGSSAKWKGTFHVPGHPETRTLDDFLSNVAAQKAVFRLHMESLQRQIEEFGLQRYIGSTIGGVPITRSGIEMMIHLGGVGGARRVLQTEGRENPRDGNGTSLLDYARIGAAIQETDATLSAP